MEAVVLWNETQVSFIISQPFYDGEPADMRAIDQHFIDAGWTKIDDPSRQHELFFNYAFNVLAIDAMPRNCYLSKENGLQPFDVILTEPSEDLEKFLRIWPDVGPTETSSSRHK